MPFLSLRLWKMRKIAIVHSFIFVSDHKYIIWCFLFNVKKNCLHYIFHKICIHIAFQGIRVYYMRCRHRLNFPHTYVWSEQENIWKYICTLGGNRIPRKREFKWVPAQHAYKCSPHTTILSRNMRKNLAILKPYNNTMKCSHITLIPESVLWIQITL